jgi:hypothetical protein
MSNLAESIFDDIRPYYDSEIPQAMHRIAASDYLPQLADFVFPDKTYDEVADLLRGITTTHEFQHQVMYYFNRQVISAASPNLAVTVFSSLIPASLIYLSVTIETLFWMLHCCKTPLSIMVLTPAR